MLSYKFSRVKCRENINNIKSLQDEREEQEGKTMYRDLTKRILALALSVCMIAGMVDLSGLTVRAAVQDLWNGTMEFTDSTSIVYDGSEHKPGVTVKDFNGNLLTEGTDYKLEYSNNVNAGSATVTAVNLADETDTLSQRFSIGKRDINSCDGFPTIPNQEIASSSATVTPQVLVTDSGNKDHTNLVGRMSDSAVPDVDYTYSFRNNKGPGTATVIITGRNNYEGSKELTFTISLLEGSRITFDFLQDVQTSGAAYNGREIKPEIADTVAYDGDKINQSDYQVRYRNNVYAGTAEAWIEVTSGRYSGLQSEPKTFNIRKNIGINVKFEQKIKLGKPIPEKSYKGGAQVTLEEEDLVLVDPDYENTPLKLGVDYEVSYNANDNKSEGPGYVQIKGIGKYTGSRTEEFQIVSARLNDPEMVNPYGADGKATYTYDINPDGSDKDQFEEVKKNVVVSNGEVVYQEGIDYTISRAPGDAGTSAGTHYIVVTSTGTGQLRPGDSVKREYKVQPRSLTDPAMHFSITNYPNPVYDGRPKTPGLLIKYEPITGGSKTLVAGVDYATPLSYTNNTNASTPGSQAGVKATGKGNFGGETDWYPFDIEAIELIDTQLNPATGNATVSGLANPAEYVYTGSAIEPNVSVTCTGRGTLQKGRDFTVSCENNIDVGMATIKISGTGNYKGELERNFTITQRDVNDAAVNIQVPASVQFTGAQLMPSVTIRHGGKTLLEDTDYTLNYGDNIDKGSGSVTVTGMGNYKGTVTKTFVITARNIAVGTLNVRDTMAGYDFAVGSADDRKYAYTGQEVRPNLNDVSYTNAEAGMNNQPLIEGRDYELEFSRNKEIGQATVTIKALASGNYTGSKQVTFTIKGDLSSAEFTKVEIPEQVYSSKPIIPENAKVTFADKELVYGKDYDVLCENNDNVDAGTATATIVGKGDYYSRAENVQFTIRMFDLSIDDLEEKEYIIGNIAENYPFIEVGHQLQPLPEIVHNGNTLEKDVHYYVSYGDNNKVGKGTLTIQGTDTNYTGSRQKEFQIVPYDLGADYAETHVELQGITDVILDAVIAGDDVNAQMTQDGQVVMSDLKVMYTPVDLDGTPLSSRELVLGDEYEVFYRDNKKIGTATITINGKGNFGGTITETFRIRGDLSSDRTEVVVADCEYTPAGNTPEPTVTYTYDGGTTETLVAGVDYNVTYENNTDSTVKSGAKAKAVISPVMAEDGITVEGNFAQSGTEPRAAEFEILQRDLTKTIGTEENPKDPSLDVTGLVEDGYEYNGLDIVPELQVTCDEIALSVGDDGDYTIAAKNNRNVYTFAETETGERGERLLPTVMVSAVKDSDGNYTGNYKGEFQIEFKINPRQISEETIKTLLRVNGQDKDDSQIPEVDYTGEEIRFPLDSSDPVNGGNDMTVTWSKEGQNTSLVENQDYKVAYADNTKIGEAKIIVSHVEFSNYEGTYERIFKIMATIEVVDQENPPLKYMTLGYDHNVPFGIVDVYPDMIFEDYSGVLCGDTNEPKILVEGEDFEIVTTENQGDAPECSRNNQNVAREDAENEAERPLVVVRGIGCYRGVIKRYYNIVPKNLTTDQGDITADFADTVASEEFENAYIYTGEPITPTIQVRNHGQLMVPNVDYTIVGYENNTAISTESKKASVTIQAVDGSNYEGRKTFYFNIIPRQISGMRVDFIGDNPVYNRKAKTPDVEVYYMEGIEKVVLTKNDYDVTYENNINAASQYAGDNAPVAIITGKGSYGGTLRKNFTIEPEPLTPAEGEADDFDVTAGSVPYTGQEVTTTITVKAKDGTLLLQKDAQNTPDVPGVRETPETPDNPDDPNVPGNPDDSENPDVPGNPDDSENPDVPDNPDDPDVPDNPVQPDYEIVGYRDNVNAGIGTVIIQGLGNYTGTREVPFNIIAPDVSEDFRVADIPEQTFINGPIEPKVSVSLSIGEGEEETQIPLTEDDYEVEYENNVNVGTATAIIKGTGNFGGEKRVNFTIVPKVIGTEEGMDPEMTLAAIEDQLYTGKGVTPDVDLRYHSQAVAQADEPEGDNNDGNDGDTDVDGRLVLGRDYTLSYLTNIPVGTASVTIVGIGNYSGNIQTQFRILGTMELAEVSSIPAQPYTGSPVTPKPEVTLAGKKLTEGEEYTLSYEDNIAQGTAKIIITGMGEWYTGEKTVTFEIARDFSNETIIKGLASAYTYTGKAITPVVVVEDHGRILSKGVDYNVSYSSNINAGTATVTITGTGRYSGTAAAQFKIMPQNIGRAVVSKIADQSYDGKDKKPSVSVVSDGITLKNGVDYAVSHVDNKNPGKASVIIKGTGNYTGTKTMSYNIVVPKVTGVKISGYSASGITFSWNRNKLVSGYEIYDANNKRVAWVKKNSTVKATVSKLKAGTTGTFRVRTYVIQGKYFYSDFVTITASTAPKAPAIKSLTSSKAKQVAIKWKKVSKATKYQVYRSTSKKGKYKKIATTNKTSYTDKKATNGKTYYYKVRALKKVGKKTYYSKYSSVKSVAAKR